MKGLHVLLGFLGAQQQAAHCIGASKLFNDRPQLLRRIIHQLIVCGFLLKILNLCVAIDKL